MIKLITNVFFTVTPIMAVIYREKISIKPFIDNISNKFINDIIRKK